MKIGIICAMEEELLSIQKALDVICTSNIDGRFIVNQANYLEHELLLNLSGIGKVNAAINTQYLIDKYQPKYIINLGVAGSLTKDLTFGDVVVADDLVQYDMDVTAFGLDLGQIPRMDCFSFKSSTKLLNIARNLPAMDFQVTTGRIISGDIFIDDRLKAEFLQQEFKALACEMEGAAVAHACYFNNIPFLVVRALSDMAGLEDSNALHSYTELKDMAALRSATIVKQILYKVASLSD